MKKIDVTQFVRRDIAGYEEYKPVLSAWDLSNTQRVSIEKINKLDAGENMFGQPPTVRKALGVYNGYQFYPDPGYKQLRRAIANYVGVDQEYIAVGNGGDELIDLILRLLLEPGDKVINCPPTFSSYELSTILNRGTIVNILREKDFSVNIEKIINAIDKKVKIIFVCNPNNPTGNTTSNQEIKKLLATGKLIFVDEAYFEFCGETTAQLVKQFNNLIVLRSFSKWAGIAGLRLGYVIMSPYLVTQIMKIKPPYNVNSAAEIAGIEALKDKKYSNKIIQATYIERERMYTKLITSKKIKMYRSGGNFLFIQFAEGEFMKVKNQFEKNNIAVRYYSSKLTGYAIRITIGTREQNDRVLQILTQDSSGVASLSRATSREAPPRWRNRTRYDGLIFDMDGILVDVSQSYREAIKQTASYFLKREVLMQEVETIKSRVGMNNDWEATYALIKNSTVPFEDVKNYFQSIYLGVKNMNGLIANERLFISKQQLMSLKNNYKKMGIATGRPRKEAEYVIKKNKLGGIFDCLVAMEDVKKDKPAPDSIIKVIKTLNLKNTVYIGDSPSDVIAAENAGIQSIYVGNQNIGTMRFNTILQVITYLL